MDHEKCAEVLGSDVDPENVLFILFIPSKDKNGVDLPPNAQQLWADAAGDILSECFVGATQMPPARGKWLNEDTGTIVSEDVVLIHSYAKRILAEDSAILSKLAEFLHRLGRETNQGEVAIVIDGVFHRIRSFRGV